MFSTVKYSSVFYIAIFSLLLFSCNLNEKKNFDIHIRVVTGNNNGIGNTFPKQITSLLTNIYSENNGGMLLKPKVTIERYDSSELGVIELKHDNLNSINYSVFTAYSNIENRAKLEQFLLRYSNDTILVFNTKIKENLQVAGKSYQPIHYYETLVSILINKIVADDQEIILLYNIQLADEIRGNNTAKLIKSREPEKKEKLSDINSNSKNKKNKKTKKQAPSQKGKEYYLNTTPGQ